MNNNITLTLIEFVASVLVEGVILSFVFMWISNQSSEKNQQNLQQEMSNIERQNKLIFEQLQLEIRNAKQDVISQIKESEK
jgi:uncharacterized membrane-anchored protein YhcB (DUF1043 family)